MLATRALVATAQTSAAPPGGTSSGGGSMSGMSDMTAMPEMHDSLEAPSGRMIVSMIEHPMIPGLEDARPTVALYRPAPGRGATIGVPAATEVLHVANGDTITLAAGFVRRSISGHPFVLYSFNRQSPGPLIHVPQGATFFVRFRNETDQPATIHWHGVRLDNPFDGAPQITQPAVAAGGTFVYAVHCPDAGVFWYHDHAREDIGQPLGLYGNLVVDRPGASSVPRTAFIMLSDILISGDSLLPYGREAPNFALMGRFGNVLLANGEPRWHATAAAGEVVRFVLTNAASARTFNLTFGDAPMKVVASDQGPFVKEAMVSSIVIAPGERYVVDVRFPKAGDVPLLNQVQTVDHMLGEIYGNTDTLGHVAVSGGTAAERDPVFETLHTDSATARDVDRYRAQFDRPPDEEIILTTAIHDLPIPAMQMMAVDTVYRPPIEFTDGMADMNWLASSREARWIIKDRRTGAENMNIAWHFHAGDVIKIRVFNDPHSFHPMEHPLHLHGQRFLVVSRDGQPNPYPVWKDTTIIPVGSTVDLLVDLTNPGTWMLHCHIAEHVESGMMAQVIVDGRR